jgi:antirestriction protein ArdC
LTYKQAAQNSWQVRQGEKGTQIEYWESPQRPTPSEKAEGAPREKNPAAIHRVYTVFNAKQIEGIEPYRPKEHPEWEVVKSGEQILRNSAAKILHDRHDEAFYDRGRDQIHLPDRSAFPSPADYYGTALHELAHWSGHEARLNRQTLANSYRFGDTNYAKEELRAELTSVFLAAERGIPHDTARHAAYVNSWIQTLKDDKHEIFRAARDAHKAADFLLALEREQSVTKALDTVEAQSYVGQRDRAAEPGADVAASTSARNHSHRRNSSTGVAAVDQSFAEAKALSIRALGDNTRIFPARTDSGIYRGEIIGETPYHIVQKLGQQSTVAHVKHLLETPPTVGQNVILRYSNGKLADLAPFEPKVKAREMAR